MGRPSPERSSASHEPKRRGKSKKGVGSSSGSTSSSASAPTLGAITSTASPPPTTYEPLVEVTLQSLKGISLRRTSTSDGAKSPESMSILDPLSQVSEMTAAIAFSGSAKDMQVSSSFLCPKTGNLMVESHCATVVSEEARLEDATASLPLSVRWNNCGDEALLVEDIPPHLTIRVPSRDNRFPRMSLSRTNRDSDIVKNFSPASPSSRSRRSNPPPSLDESECSTAEEEEVMSPCPSFETDVQSSVRGGPSVAWSASGKSMPDIIELHVNIKLDADNTTFVNHRENSTVWTDTVFEIGVAHLVFFGNDEGTTIMDLPIKKHHPTRTFADGQIVVEDSARLRIKVSVWPRGRIWVPRPQPKFCSGRYKITVADTKAAHDKKVLEPIIQQLRQVEDQLEAVGVGGGGGGVGEGGGRGTHHLNLKQVKRAIPETKSLPASHLLCDIGMLDLFSTLQEAVQCEHPVVGNGAASGRRHFPSLIHRQDSMASTIQTAASLQI